MPASSVVVVCPKARRETVKINPNTSILQILEEACKKQKLNPHEYDIRHYNKILDLTLPVRFANIPNNAVLELHPAKNVRTECLVTVGLQLESGERFMKDFDPNCTVHDVLDKCLSSESIAIDGEPVCIYMRQKISGDAIKRTTLRSLGLTKGQAIIRLMYRKPEDLEDQAHVATPLVVSSVSEATAKSKIDDSPISPATPILKNSDSNVNEAQIQDMSKKLLVNNIEESITSPFLTSFDHSEHKLNFNSPSPSSETDNSTIFDEKHVGYGNEKEFNENVEMECDDVKDDSPIGDVIYVGGHQAVLYSLNDITSSKKADLPDEFFDLTINDVKYLMEEYKSQRLEMENQPLLTKEQRDRRILQKLAHYSQTVLRIYFPERLVLQVVFSVLDTIQMVSEFLREFLMDGDLKFHLYITPPKQILHPSKTLLESMLVPASVLYFGCDYKQPFYLNMGLKEKISDPRAAALAAVKSRKSNLSSNPIVEISIENINEQSNKNQEVLQDNSASSNKWDSTETKSAKIPSWFKMKK